MAKSWLKVLNYFHHGAQSLAENWEPPADGVPYKPKARVLGITATPDEKLGQFFDYFVEPPYSLLTAVCEGWLVPPITRSIPLKIDIRNLRPGRTPNGSDFKAEEIAAKLIPVIEALAIQIKAMASNRKTIAFTPSVECARLLADAVTRAGLLGIFVSGECLDVDEKTQAYVDAGPGTVLCNCALYTEGADFPDTDCVIVARATKSRGFYRQMVGRGTRVLPGIVDGLATPEERRAAIAASAKPNLLILDPLWIHEKIDLCEAYDLVTDKPEVKKLMKEQPGEELIEKEQKAERDFIAALEKEARKHRRKAERIIDPLALAVSLGDSTIAEYKPESTSDSMPMTDGQRAFLVRQGIDPSNVQCKGLASKVIGRVVNRMRFGLASVAQLDFLRKLGFDDQKAAVLTAAQAGAAIDATLKDKRGRA